MKVVILAGGFGTRISEESHLKPKPMIEIGDMPIIWHIMKYYSSYGHNEFIICCGYKQFLIKEFFANYFLYQCDVTFDFKNNNEITVHSNNSESWKITVVDTGLHTMTGGRLKRVQKYIHQDEPFMLTYGDGVCDVDLDKLEESYKKSNKILMLTAVNLDQRLGVISLDENGEVTAFREKKQDDSSLINGGFMIMNSKVFDYIKGDETILEKEPLENLVKSGEMGAYIHNGFWQCMDTQRDKFKLEDLWNKGCAPWKRW